MLHDDIARLRAVIRRKGDVSDDGKPDAADRLAILG